MVQRRFGVGAHHRAVYAVFCGDAPKALFCRFFRRNNFFANGRGRRHGISYGFHKRLLSNKKSRRMAADDDYVYWMSMRISPCAGAVGPKSPRFLVSVAL